MSPQGTLRFALRTARGLVTVFLLSVFGAIRGRRERGELVRQMYHLGNRSVLFVMVTLGFIGMVMIFQTCLQLNRVTGDLSQVGAEYAKLLVHALGPILTAMMLSTRIGAGIAAEIGSMVVTEQVDALRMCGVEPIEYLVAPRFLASLIMTPLLTVIGITVAFAMSTLTAYHSFHVSPGVFLDFSKVTFGDLMTGGLKTLAFGAAIPVVSGYCGMEAHGGSEGVGWATTRAVVSSSFAVIILEFLIAGVAFFTLQAG